MPAGQFVRPFRDFHASSYHAAKRRIKKTALPWRGQVQQLPGGVQKVAVRNPALKAVRGAGLDDLPGLAYAVPAGVVDIKITRL